MKDYRLINDAISTAEELLKNYSESSQIEIKIHSESALDKIAEYLYNVLCNADFPVIHAFEAHWFGKKVVGVPFGEMDLTCDKTGYVVNSCRFYAQLYVRVGSDVTRLYFNRDGYIVTGKGHEQNLIFLFYYWKNLKAQLEPAIDNYFEVRNMEVKKNLEIVNKQKSIVENFEV